MLKKYSMYHLVFTATMPAFSLRLRSPDGATMDSGDNI